MNQQYPDDVDLFELEYQDELELLEELPHDYDEFGPSTSHQARLFNRKQSNVLNNTQQSSAPSLFNSSQLSQISFGQSDGNSGNGPVNRRLFGTPNGSPQRGCSTPLTTKPRMPPIKELTGESQLAVLEEQDEIALNVPAIELQNCGLRSKRRLERDLFGNIDDLYHNDTYEDPLLKKARTEEQRDMEMIEKILELRKKALQTSKTVRTDELSRLKELHQFKMNNLSYDVPAWPFLVLERSDLQRIYVRFHSNEYEKRAIDAINVRNDSGGLLGKAKQQVWNEANDIVLRRAVAATNENEIHQLQTETAVPAGSKQLWVEKYKPRKYIDLLSDEMTNRSLLYWLKMWDKVVFGKEFHIKSEENTRQLNSFNKRTGKFESMGGWRSRKAKQNLNTNVDELGRPMQKVTLLCGPPGLGKTTLAHTIAQHAGYNAREINASDDRSPEAFKLALENGTQMSSVLNENKRPNCIILDEIDGAPKQSIEYLVKFVSDNVYSKARGKGMKAERKVLKRPIICICNDVYDPALRPLRLIAFVLNFPPIETSRLAERLQQIAYKESLKTDFSSLIALAEKSGNDVRSCISTMQFFSAQKQSLTLQDVLNNNLGLKDRHQGLFDVWGAIFRVQRPKKQLQLAENKEESSQITMTDMSIATRVRNVLNVVHLTGDYERLMQGVYENYLQQKMPDPNMYGVVEALHWFCFSDSLQHQINQQQNYAVYPYLQYGFVVWHLLFATLAWPKIIFPTRGYEFNQKCNNQRNIFQTLSKGITTRALGIGQGTVLLIETVPLLKRILSPQLRSVAIQLLSQKEQNDLRHTIDVMVDLGITFVQVKSAEGHYVFQVEPDLDTLAAFTGYPGITLPYFSRQLIAREIELERIRRATPKTNENDSAGKGKSTTATTTMAARSKSAKMPNHLQRLQPKQLTDNQRMAKPSSMICKDFFGRIQEKIMNVTPAEVMKTDAIVKSPIWYRYKEGFNNAVRKDVHMSELL